MNFHIMQTSKNLIYRSIDTDSSDQCPEISRLITACLSGIFYEPWLPSDRSRTSRWGLTTMPQDRFPDLDQSYRYDFAETTDRRSLELAHKVSEHDLPVVVYWSGGIDSTVVLTALIKNWPRALRDRIIVLMNHSSIFENPWFYDKIIRANGMVTTANIDRWQPYVLVTGNPADSLWIQSDIVEMEAVWPGSSQWSVDTHKDILIKWIAHKSSLDLALWFYDLVVDGAKQAGIVLYTMEDFYWWWNFNFGYTGQIYKYLGKYQHFGSVIDLAQWNQQHLGWYHTRDYQLWSANNRSNGVKINGTVRSYKWPAKCYIYDLDRNSWYRDYKTKTGSGNPYVKNTLKAVYDDGSMIF